MRRKITIEFETDEQTANEVAMNIEATVLGQFGAHTLNEFIFHKEDFPECCGAVLQVPDFLVNRPFGKKVAADGL